MLCQSNFSWQDGQSRVDRTLLLHHVLLHFVISDLINWFISCMLKCDVLWLYMCVFLVFTEAAARLSLLCGH